MLSRLSLGLLNAQERERLATMVSLRLNAPLTALGFIHALLVFGILFSNVGSALSFVFIALTLLIFAVFIAEFVARMVIAPSNTQFLREHWRQLIFVILPVLRFIEIMRMPQSQRLMKQAMRAGRSALRVLAGRLGYLLAATVIVTLIAAQVLFAFGDYSSYGAALHGASFGVITGEPLEPHDSVSDVTELALAFYSTVVFAALAGTIGAFFIERRGYGYAAPVQPDAVEAQPDPLV